MWKLKYSEIKEGQEFVTSVNNHIGRQYWEFDQHAGTEQERTQVEQAQEIFKDNRFINKNSSDLIMRLQVYIHT